MSEEKPRYKSRIKDRVYFTPVIEPQDLGVKAGDLAEAAAKMASAEPLPETTFTFQRVHDVDPMKVREMRIGEEVIPVECVEVKRGPDDTVTYWDEDLDEERTRRLAEGEMQVTFRRTTDGGPV